MPNRDRIWLPSVKNGRFSSKNVSEADRFTTAGSTSTCPKSGFTVASSVRLLATPYFTSTPVPANARLPSLNGLPGFGGATYSLRAVTYGSNSRCLARGIPASPSRWGILEARPLSLLGVMDTHDSSPLRWTMRWALTPQVSTSACGKRSCENGIRISTVQPPSSRPTADSHTASHVSSW